MRSEGLASKTLCSLLVGAGRCCLQKTAVKALQNHLDPERLVFMMGLDQGQHVVDQGLGTKGTRLRAFAPHGHWRTLTFLGLEK
ncbi:hypothetical protein ACFO1V_10230 [Daeguia caeni]|uniref:Uncharacterized protein n=1 Tax=Daeguia caeni TaxID=439612 RepID=A0ABV9H6K6_9HYPH